MPTKTETGQKPEVTEDFVEDKETREFVKKVVKDHPEQSIYILPRKGAEEITTEKRMQLIRQIRNKQPKSIRDLARTLNRDVKSVSRDLDTLWKNDIIQYKKEKNRKIPELTADKIIIEPL